MMTTLTPAASAPRALREDLALRSTAETLGWSEALHVHDRERGCVEVPHFPLSFAKGDKRLWFCAKGWACADLTGNGSSVAITYRNHRYHPTLAVALERES